MRLIPIRLWLLATLLAMLATGMAAPGSVRADRAEPLDVPLGLVVPPEVTADLDQSDRVERAHRAFEERGYTQLPVLAWALLDAAGSPEDLEQIVELAPTTPSVLFEAARRSRDPAQLARSVAALIQSFPGVVWLLTLAGAALGLGAFLAAAWAILIGFLRTVNLHGHAFGHATAAQDPPSWPGVLLVLSGLALLPLASQSVASP